MENYKLKKAKIKSFKDLIVWQVAIQLSKDICQKLVTRLPNREQLRLGDQIIRSSRSVPALIAEGFKKSSLKEKHHYYEMASTSNDETENHLVEINNNNFIDEKNYKQYLRSIIKIRILLSRLKKSVRNLVTVS